MTHNPQSSTCMSVRLPFPGYETRATNQLLFGDIRSTYHQAGPFAPKAGDRFVSGQLLKIEVLDDLVIGRGEFKSLRELGYFALRFIMPSVGSILS